MIAIANTQQMAELMRATSGRNRDGCTTFRWAVRVRRGDAAPIGPISKGRAGSRRNGFRRCIGCGYLVRLPCLICSVRSALAEELGNKRRQLQPDPQDPLRLQLRGAHRRRYERIHARKVAQHRRSSA